MFSWWRSRWVWPLAAILLLAWALRLYGIGFGLPGLNDPDELMFEMGSVRMLRGPTLNPGWFGHPATTTIYALAVVNVSVFLFGHLVGWFESVKAFGDAIYADPSWAILPGRVLMSLFGVAVVWLTARLGTALTDRRTGLMAAALMAINPLAISYSQVIRSDMMACVFMLLCLLAAQRIAQHGRWRDYVLASLWLGLAIATKWPFALSALAVMACTWIRVQDDPAGRGRALRNLLGFGVLSVCILLLVSPYLLLDYRTVILNLRGEAQSHHLGATGEGVLSNAWWYLSQPIFQGLGLAGLILLVPGALHLRRNRTLWATVGVVVLAFIIVICTQRLIWARWALPLMPLLSVIVAAGLVSLLDRLGTLPSRGFARVAMALLFAATLVPLLGSGLSQARERLNDTRQQAAGWARAHIKPGSTVLIEHFAFDLIAQPWQFRFPMGEAGCIDAKAYLQGKVPYSTIERNRTHRSNVDFGTLPSARADGCAVDYAILTQYDRYKAERDVFPAENANYERLIARGRIVASFVPEPGISGGPIVRIVQVPRAANQP